jgi:hypothetical protein
MESSRWNSLRAVWLVQSRKLRSKLEFWLVLIGYNRRTHSFSSFIYLVYVIIFFSVWIFVMLVFLAGIGGKVLEAIPLNTPLTTAQTLGEIAFGTFIVLDLYATSRRSPFVFSEADSHMLCQTPVDRPVVAIIWFLVSWLERGLFLWPAAIVLGYALVEARSPTELSLVDLPSYLLAGWRILIIVIPLHLGAQSLSWSVGAWRLKGKDERFSLRWAAPVLAVALIGGWFISRLDGGLLSQIWYWLVGFPILSGLGSGPLIAGLGLSLGWAILGISVLWLSSREMNLARAFQESHGQEARRAAILTGAFDLGRELQQRERLGVGRKPSPLPARPGITSLVWRNMIQRWRTFTLGGVFPWLGILGLTLGAILVPDWGSRGWFFALWLLLVGGRVTYSLRMDLGHWWLMHQLPSQMEVIFLMDMVIPLVIIELISLLILPVALFTGSISSIFLCWILIMGCVGTGLAASLDITIQSRTEKLLEGIVPNVGWLTVVVGGLILGIPGGFAWLALRVWSMPTWFGILAILAISMSLDYLLFILLRSFLRKTSTFQSK